MSFSVMRQKRVASTIFTCYKTVVKTLFSAILSGLVISSSAQAETTVDFAKEIQPILQKSCVECHGPDKHKADLRLDGKETALKGGKDGPVIVPKDAAKSE